MAEDSLHIRDGSPCLNSGTRSVIFEDLMFTGPSTDLDGDQRSQRDGGVDVGADELLAVGIISSSFVEGEVMKIYPNPFRDQATIKLYLEKPSDCVIEIHNSYSEKVGVISPGKLDRGDHHIPWKSVDLPSGFYHLRMIKGGEISSAKVLHLN